MSVLCYNSTHYVQYSTMYTDGMHGFAWSILCYVTTVHPTVCMCITILYVLISCHYKTTDKYNDANSNDENGFPVINCSPCANVILHLLDILSSTPEDFKKVH